MKDRSVKVCMISGTHRDEPYGSSIRPTCLAECLAGQGVEVLHFARKHSASGDKIPGLKNYDLLEGSWKNRFEIIFQVLKHSPPDVIYTHQIESAKLGLVLSFFLHIPHVYDAHSSIALEASTYKHFPIDIKKRQYLFERMIVMFSHMIIVPSPELKDYLRRRYHLKSAKIVIVKNGADGSRFFPALPDKCLRESLHLGDAFLVVFPNPRLPTFPSNEMALRHLFDMIPEIEKRIPRIKFLILGGGPQPKGPSDNIVYTGYVNDLASYINAADVCVAPFPEQAVCGGTRTKICEYLACGKPIVATGEAMRGFDDAVPGKHYFLANNAEDFVRQVAECFHFPDKRIRIGQNARMLSEHYDWAYLSKELKMYLMDAVSSGNGRKGRGAA